MAEKRKHGIVKAKRLNVRAAAGLEGKVMDIIKAGTQVEIIDEVEDKNGEKWLNIPGGYVMAKWIEAKK